MKNARDGGEATLEAFRNLRVDYIFSSPGSEWSPVWEAMSRQIVDGAEGPAMLDCWHETLAVDMALGYTAYTGRMQAVLLHAGVGLVHGAMALLTATKSEIPTLVLSGESDTYGDDPQFAVEPQWYGGVSEGGAQRFVAPIVKYACQTTNAATLFNTIVRAGEIAQRAPRGPCYVNLSIEALLHEWRKPEGLRPAPEAPRTRAAPADVEAVAAMLREARSPVIVTESAGRDPAAFAALAALAEELAIPVVGVRAATYANLPHSHPMWLGYANTAPLQDSDLVLVVEARAPFYPPSRRPGTGKVVVIAETPLKTQLGYQVLHADRYLEGDVAASLEMLRQAAAPSAGEREAISRRRERWTKAHDEMVADLAAREARALAAESLDAIGLAAVAARVLPPDAIVCDETITHMPVMRGHLRLESPQSFFRITGGALGQGLGAALGLKLAAQERPVMLFVGDGSFLYNPIVQALGAAKAHRLPITIVVCNNRRYEAMRKGHMIYYAGGVADTTRFHHGVEIEGPEYQELGRPFGCFGAAASNPKELEAALRDALTANREGRTAIVNAALVA